MPHFFKYAKDYEESGVEPINNSFVNKLEGIFKNKKIVYRNLPKLNYKILMSNPLIVLDDNLIKCFDRFNRTYHYKLSNTNSKTINIAFLAQSIREELASFGYSIFEVTDMLVKYLYSKQTKNKSCLWFCYGQAIVRNIYKNIDKRQTYCMKCGKRFPKEGAKNYCDDCRQKSTTKTIKCIDCGEKFEVPAANKRTVRCPKCQAEHRKAATRISKQKSRNKIMSTD